MASTKSGNKPLDADVIRTHKTNPNAAGPERENQSHKLAARRRQAAGEIKSQQRRI